MQCSEKVSRRSGRWYHTSGCLNTATIERDGKWYCGTHDPEKIKARRDKRDAERRQEMEQRTKVSNAADAQVRRLIKLLGDDMNYEVSVGYVEMGRNRYYPSGVRLSSRAAARLITLLSEKKA